MKFRMLTGLAVSMKETLERKGYASLDGTEGDSSQ